MLYNIVEVFLREKSLTSYLAGWVFSRSFPTFVIYLKLIYREPASHEISVYIAIPFPEYSPL